MRDRKLKDVSKEPEFHLCARLDCDHERWAHRGDSGPCRVCNCQAFMSGNSRKLTKNREVRPNCI